jgi:hypothetical protein
MQKIDITAGLTGRVEVAGFASSNHTLFLEFPQVGQNSSPSYGKKYPVVEDLHTNQQNRMPVVERLLEFADMIAPLKRQLNEIELATESWRLSVPEPTSASIDDARALLDRLQANEVVPYRITPSADGGIGICIKSDGAYADFECDNEGIITGLISDGRGRVEAFPVDPSFEGRNQAIAKVKAFFASRS